MTSRTGSPELRNRLVPLMTRVLTKLLKLFKRRADNKDMSKTHPILAISDYSDERGFTLPELLVTILIVAIVSTIGAASWLNVTQARKVDSATNQFAADLRLMHSRAANQLTDWRVVYTNGGASYTVQKLSQPCLDTGCGTPIVTQTVLHSLPQDTRTLSAGILEFNVDGSARSLSGSDPTTIVIGYPNGGPTHTVEVRSATSRIKIAP